MPIDPRDYVEYHDDQAPPPRPHPPEVDEPDEGRRDLAPPPPPESHSPPPPPARPSIQVRSGDGIVKLIEGLVELSLGEKPPIPESLRRLTTETLDALELPSAIPTHRLSPSSRWKWGLGILGAYTVLAIFTAARTRRARRMMAAAQAQMQAQMEAEQSGVTQNQGTGPNIEVEPNMSEVGGNDDQHRDDSRSGYTP
jgi:hypothetical protein